MLRQLVVHLLEIQLEWITEKQGPANMKLRNECYDAPARKVGAKLVAGTKTLSATGQRVKKVYCGGRPIICVAVIVGSGPSQTYPLLAPQG